MDSSTQDPERINSKAPTDDTVESVSGGPVGGHANLDDAGLPHEQDSICSELIVRSVSGRELLKFEMGPKDIIRMVMDKVINATPPSDNKRLYLANGDRVLQESETATEAGLCSGSEITAVFYDKPPSKVLTISADSTARLFDTECGTCMQIFDGHNGAILTAAFSKDASLILTASSDCTAKLFDAQKGTCSQSFTGHSKPLTGACFSPDESEILTTSYDNTARLFDVSNGSCKRVISGLSVATVMAVFLLPDAKLILATSLENGSAKLIDKESGDCKQSFHGHRKQLRTVASSPDGKTVLTCSRDNTVKLFDTESGDCLQTFQGHLKPVGRAIFSSDATQVLSVSDDCSAKLFDTKSGKCIHSLYGHISPLYMASFSPDGKKSLNDLC